MRKTNPQRAESECNGLSRSFKWLNATQFLGALNDNVLKLFIVFFLIGVRGAQEAGAVSATAGAVFVVPFLLFSAWAGVIADRASKRTVTVSLKAVEFAVAVLAAAAFYMKSEAGLYAVLFLMASQSAFFAPSKYGIVPELVRREGLSRANSLLESFTYLAIILGSALAPFLAELTSSRYDAAALFCVAIALGGLYSSRKIGPTAPAGSDRRLTFLILRDIWRTFRDIRRDRALLLAVLGSAYFMFIGAFVQINLIPYGMEALGLTQEKSGYLFFVGALAIGAGSLVSGRLSGRGVEFGVVPLGALGISVSAAGLHVLPAGLPVVVACVFLLGFGAGLFIVPLQTFIQMRSPRGRLGEILAASGFLNWTAVLLAAVAAYAFGIAGLTAGQGFLVIGLATALLAVVAVKTLPDFLIRFFTVVIAKLVYRLRVMGEGNIPLEGPAVLVSNHVSWVDSFMVMGATRRRIRFVMDRGIYNRNRLLRAALRLMGVIPVSQRDSQKEIVSFVRQARAALDEGYILCIFAEGAITRNGMLQEFKPGFELVARKSGCPVIPVHIGGLWGSVFSYANGGLMSGPLAAHRVTTIVGETMPSSSTAPELRRAVMELSTQYFESEKDKAVPLGEAFIKSARRNWGRKAVSDSTGKNLTYGRTLAGALAISDRLKKDGHADGNIGILLPPSVGGALVNLAVSISGNTPVNLNYTAPRASVDSAIRQCGITRVITSRAFAERPGLTVPSEGLVYIEDVMADITALSRLKAWAKSLFMPRRLLVNKRGFSPGDTAAVMFSSGSSGEPKGVMLTHHNILSNIESLRMVLRLTPEDNICAALPFFHSLGFTGTLWLPLLSGFSASYHPNPLDGSGVARTVRANRSTLMLATPTFLTVYARSAMPEDYSSLRLVVTGAEKLTERVAGIFARKFGITPLEGYGATELSPVIAISVPDVEIDGVRHRGSAKQSVGRPVPGVSVRVVDPETGTPVPDGESGLILVRGPNLMKGYLGRPELSLIAVKDGWYNTGDIGRLGTDGFLFITDRLARFSKIAGEMVPHCAVEDELHSFLNKPSRMLAVAGVPDDRKGERLVVVYEKGESDAQTLRQAVAGCRLPNLWKPGKDAYVEVESLPILGSGKLDIRALKTLALGTS